MEEKEREQEVDALCPECGNAFKLFVDRIIPSVGETTEDEHIECPVCGCAKCTIGK